MTRRSTRANFGKKPGYLDNYSLSFSDSETESSFFDTFNSTIMPETEDDQKQSLNSLLLSLSSQMEEMKCELKKLKEKDNATEKTSIAAPPPNLSEYGHSSNQNLNTQTSNLSIHPEDVDFRDYKRKLYDLPVFDGSLEQWPKFYQAFINTTTAYKYTKLENLIRLEKALKGKAKEAVEAMLIHPESIDDAMLRLKFLYGDSESLIKSQISKIKEIPPIQDHKLEQLISFSTKLDNLRAFVISSECEKYLSNPLLIEELLSKLSITKQVEWMKFKDSFSGEPTLKEFCDWVSRAAKYASMVSHTSPLPTSQKAEKKTQKNQMFHTKEQPKSIHPVTTPVNSVTTCTFCQKSHKITECEEFSNLSNDEKWNCVKENSLCFCCLKKGHPIRFCRSKRLCGVNQCNKQHHKLLHLSTSDDVNEKNNKEPVLINRSPVNSQVLFKILPVTLHANNRAIDSFAFIDEGSSATLIDEKIADHLGLDGSKESLTLQWLDKQEITQQSRRVTLEISGRNSTTKYTLYNVQTVKGINLPIQSLDISKLSNKCQAIKRLPIQKFDNAFPKILIGLNNIHVAYQSQQRLCSDEGPIAVHTKLGWLVYGTIHESKRQSVVQSNLVKVMTVREVDQDLDYINNQMKEYFSTEGFGCVPKRKVQSAADARAEMIFKLTTKKTAFGYETGLLWKEDDIQFPESKSIAIHRLQLVEKRMSKDEEYARMYKENMNRFIQQGYAKKMTEEEINRTSPRTYYLPHFGVKNPSKPNKLRIVFDAASKTDGLSLNDFLLTGPDLYENLLAILFRFRQGKVAVCADVREMFLQVRIIDVDQDSQRFLWRNGDQSMKPEVYKMSSMIFGAKCSPASAQYVKNHHAEKFTSEFPIAAKAMKSSHYMDDFIHSFDDIQDAIEISQQVTEIHKSAGFELRNFLSNNCQVARVLRKHDELKPAQTCESLQKTDKILGMHWNSFSDKLLFELKFYKVDPLLIDGYRYPTKRELLSITMSIYDPYGFLGNFTIYVKLLLQDMWSLNIDWDQKIPTQLEEKWDCWLQELHKVKYLRIPRCYCPSISEASHIELHLFVDASERAFSAVAYFRIICGTSVFVSFVASKTRCAPIKYMTVPRKELQGAVLGARLKTAIMEAHTIDISKVMFWSDSKTVISWIQSDHRTYKTFVANRVSEILDHSDAKDWRWVPTAMNVADDATRDIYPPKFETSTRWINGPEWLLVENNWPTEDVSVQETTEEKRLESVYTAKEDINVFDLAKFSTYSRAQRVISWVLRWITNARSIFPKKQGQVLSSKELMKGENLLCRWSQRESFPKELHALKNGECISNSSKILCLTPFLDADGLLKVNGRTDNATVLPIYTKKPIILDKEHRLTKLIVDHYHKKLHHINEGTVMCEIRRKFWVNGLRRAVRQAKTNCMECKINSAKPVPQQMGQLPIDRLTPFIRPFTFTGMDYFGPINITVGRRIEKRWVVLFTCLTIRGVHIEIARDLSADQCILCLRNFFNTRGVPSRIRSDNGSNLVGAKNELNATNLFNDDRVRNEAENRGVEWCFICPANPAEGGCWERMVQSIKKVLQKVLKTVAPREETLRSFLLEAVNIVNSRPLTHIPVSCNEEEPLTPNHFILGEASGMQGPGPIDDKIWTLRKQWRIAQNLKNHFWNRWVNEILPFLTRRTKWYKLEKPIQLGDLVIICDNNLVRNEWRRGIVSKLFPDKKNIVRSAEVTTSTGTLKRPVSKLAILDVKSECHPRESITGGGNVAE